MIYLYNTLHKRKEKLEPLKTNKIKLYTCGPTVYDFAHIGNFRAYLFEDLLRRFLEFCNFEVLHVMNITDIDDKTIKKSINENVSLKKLTDKYSSAFFEDVEKLNIKKAHHYPRATNFIKEIITMIQKLENGGFTYTTDDNSVFFRISEFKEYGNLANINPEDMLTGDRVENDEYDKEEARDFVLWKGYKIDDGDVSWDSPWGKGRPGWHIECSVMSTYYLGGYFDIHCGGVDNIFPHHENEIAQSRCALEDKFVKYWLHNEHLIVDNKKMSKSTGNFYTIRDLLNKGYTADSIRYALISSHYRQKLNFTFERLENSQKSINKLRELLRRLKQIENNNTINIDNNFNKICSLFNREFKENLSNDLNISASLGSLFIWVNKIFILLDENKLNKQQAKKAISLLMNVDQILGVITTKEDISENIKKLIKKREEARKNKDWEESDRIRNLLNKEGIIIEDTPKGTTWKFK